MLKYILPLLAMLMFTPFSVYATDTPSVSEPSTYMAVALMPVDDICSRVDAKSDLITMDCNDRGDSDSPTISYAYIGGGNSNLSPDKETDNTLMQTAKNNYQVLEVAWSGSRFS